MHSLLFLALYFAIVNLIGFLLFGIDKRKARKGAFRIPELTLFVVALIGGALGSFLGMHVFHHKTRKPSFKIGLPLIVILQAALVLFLIFQPIPIRFL